MDHLRKEAHEALEHQVDGLPQTLPSAQETGRQVSVQDAWMDVSTFDNGTPRNLNENLYVIVQYLKGHFDPQPLNDGTSDPSNVEAVGNILEWASKAALPSIEFELYFSDDSEISGEIANAQEQSRLKGELATSVIQLLTSKTTLNRKWLQSSSVVMACACYTSDSDPWSTKISVENAKSVLDLAQIPWGTVDEILKTRIRPLFNDSKNPSITSEGRKNFHPLPLSRFEGMSLDESTKPWKGAGIYATRILSWIIHQYQSNETSQIEAHFPLLVPVILTLIDDSNITFKASGCDILSQTLESIRQHSSKIFLRMNLVSVFEEAIAPCLLSIPSITPEQTSLKLLSSAYPALISVFEAGYQTSQKNGIKGNQTVEDTSKNNRAKFVKSMQKVIRANLISSFHHVSSSTPASKETSASFPYPRLSKFLMRWIGISIQEIGFHSTVLLQDIVPVLYSTLSNPFGTAYPALIATAVWTTKQLVLNAHARIFKWRGEILGGLTWCYFHITDELQELQQNQEGNTRFGELAEIVRDLKITVSALKFSLQNLGDMAIVDGEDSHNAKNSADIIENELQELVDADPRLEELFLSKGDIRKEA